MMPPPPRPNKEDKDDRGVGVDEIGDSLYGSGINLKDEENYLHNTWNNRHGNESFGTAQSTSFGSSTMSPNNSFNMLTQSTSFGSQGQNRATAGTLSQPRSQEQIEAEVKQKREAAARKLAEYEQHHLNNQFLLGNCLRHRMHKRATENAVRLDITGVYVRNPDARPQSRVMVDGNANEGIVEAKAESMIEAGAPYEAILSLISLAAGERLRGMVGDAYGLARARRYGDHGRVVPPEFADIAVGEGAVSQETVVPENITGSQWEQTGERPNANGETVANGESEKETSLPAQTISFQGTLNAQLRAIADRERQAEKERTRKREARRRKLAAEGGDESMSADIPAEMLAQAEAPVKMTKKEANKKAKENSTEALGVKQSNQTAAMMTMGKKGKKYSWMTGGVSNMPTNKYLKPSAPPSGTATPKEDSGAAADAPLAAAAPKPEKVPTWGDWREDSVNGKGIQLRDWIRILERDGKEKKALQNANNKLA